MVAVILFISALMASPVIADTVRCEVTKDFYTTEQNGEICRDLDAPRQCIHHEVTECDNGRTYEHVRRTRLCVPGWNDEQMDRDCRALDN